MPRLAYTTFQRNRLRHPRPSSLATGTVAPGTYAWAGAKAYCAGLNLAGTGWRLPTDQGATDHSSTILRRIPSIDTTALSLDAGRLVLVIVAVGRLIVLAWGRRLGNGYADNLNLAVPASGLVRCVR